MNNVIKKDRLLILGAILALLLVVYLVFLYKLQIIEGERYYRESRNNMVTVSTVTAARGNILDRYGRMLVTNKSTKDIAIDENKLFPNDESVDANSTILKLVDMIRSYGEDYTDELPISREPPFEFTDMSSVDKARLTAYEEANGLDENATAVEVMSSMRSRYKIDGNYSAEEARIIAAIRYSINVRYLINTSDYVLVEDADMKLIASALESGIPGISIKESYVREYNTTAASHILGYVNWMNEDQYVKYKELGYSANTKVGQSGVEEAFEKYLHGTDGTVRVTSSSNGTVISTEYTTEPIPGNNVYLTIDLALQEAAETALETGIDTIRMKLGVQKEEEIADGTYKPKNDEITGGAAAVVDVKTGEPLALATYPTYNVSELLEKYNEILKAPNNPLYNRATQGQYAPGSTFKPCVAMMGLTDGVIGINTSINCTGQYTKYADQGYAPYCWVHDQLPQGHGMRSVVEALRDSCNIFFFQVGHDAGIVKLDKYAKLFGLGESTGIEITESTGNMSNRDNHYDLVGEEWSIGDTMQAAIGQSDSIFTPLQLAEYCAAIANNGSRHTASLLKSVRSYDYSERLFEREPEVLSKVESSQANWDAVHQGMYLVANNWSGSGYSVFQTYTASSVACKTGTAQKGEYITNDGIFICYAPYENPEIAVAVVVERGSSGAMVGSIAREILEQYFALKKTTYVTDTEGVLLK